MTEDVNEWNKETARRGQMHAGRKTKKVLPGVCYAKRRDSLWLLKPAPQHKTTLIKCSLFKHECEASGSATTCAKHSAVDVESPDINVSTALAGPPIWSGPRSPMFRPQTGSSKGLSKEELSQVPLFDEPSLDRRSRRPIRARKAGQCFQPVKTHTQVTSLDV